MKSKPNSRQKTITGRFIEKKDVKSPCRFCKVKVFDRERHEIKCHKNPANIPRTIYNWNYFEEYALIEEFLINNPMTEKIRKFNQRLAPEGNPFDHITGAMLPYMKKLPKNHLEKQMYAKLHKDISRGIELKLLTEDEFIQRIIS
ncbi:hypothetical protein LCGC14_2393510 [marine sediment metagenome]|uniref:Uncharacterized protein n=1 Tax=marine sediment metagenome TaxID=412755 RepID=A0A0F9CJJ1_9ZZZZ